MLQDFLNHFALLAGKNKKVAEWRLSKRLNFSLPLPDLNGGPSD